MKYRVLKEEALRCQCRDCLNLSYGLKLQRMDCIYLPYPEPCRTCGQMRNIVADISRSKRWQLWLHRKDENQNRGEDIT